jgi:hypothetical protein
VPKFAIGAVNDCKKAQSPGIRGFGGFSVQEFFSDSDLSGLKSVPNAGSWCIEAVHNLQIL